MLTSPTEPELDLRNVHLKISAPLLFNSVEEKLEARTVLSCLLFLFDKSLLKNFSHVRRVAKSRY